MSRHHKPRRTRLATALAAFTILLVPAATADPVAVVDTFETGLQGWTVTGNAATTTAQAHTGEASLMTAPAGPFSQARVSRSLPNVQAGVANAWFYDDMAGCGSPGAKKQAMFLNIGGRAHAITADTDWSACQYTYRFGVAQPASGVPRSLGWHQFTIAWDGTAVSYAIDGTVVHASPWTGAATSIFLGDAWGPANPTPGYWDDVVVVGA